METTFGTSAFSPVTTITRGNIRKHQKLNFQFHNVILSSVRLNTRGRITVAKVVGRWVHKVPDIDQLIAQSPQ